MRHFISLVICVILSGCAQRQPNLTLGQTYEAVRVGEPGALQPPVPPDSEVKRSGNAWGAARYQEWDHSTGATEWLIVVHDEQGKVIGKRYQVRGESGSATTLMYHRFDRSEWELAITDKSELLRIGPALCEMLSFSHVGFSGVSNGIERLESVPADRDVNADDLWKFAAETNYALSATKPLKHTSTDRSAKLAPCRTRWIVEESRPGVVRLVVAHDTDVSLVLWTLAGWGHVLNTGELP